MYKIYFYVPDMHVEQVKAVMFTAGAGRIDAYEHCAWQTKGTGQYRPLAGSNPHLGELNKLNHEEEYLVEMVCDSNHIKPVLQALLAAHPYETPAYGAWKILTLDDIDD